MIETKKCSRCGKVKDISLFETNPIRKQCRDCRNALRRYFRVGDRQRESRLKFNYGITIADFDRMEKDQQNVCAICGGVTKNNRWGRTLMVDHCHKTGKVRQLLCDICNKGLGHFRDNIDIMEKAIAYLRKHSE